jgi:Rieske Fe-S protein
MRLWTALDEIDVDLLALLQQDARRTLRELGQVVGFNGLVGNLPSFTIMSSRCTHVGCPTQPNGPVFAQRHKLEQTSTGEVGLVPTLPSGGFGCLCHGSQFDTEGNRTAGPAVRALDRYQFSIRNGDVVLGRVYSVSRVQGAGANARIHAFALKGAGEPVTGPESLLYPLNPSS